jgi:hypothetical protein
MNETVLLRSRVQKAENDWQKTENLPSKSRKKFFVIHRLLDFFLVSE